MGSILYKVLGLYKDDNKFNKKVKENTKKNKKICKLFYSFPATVQMGNRKKP
jgi:hypothetical protein